MENNLLLNWELPILNALQACFVKAEAITLKYTFKIMIYYSDLWASEGQCISD